MNFLDKLKERVERTNVAAREIISDAVVPDDIKTERMDHCNSCEFLFKPTMQCRKCG